MDKFGELLCLKKFLLNRWSDEGRFGARILPKNLFCHIKTNSVWAHFLTKKSYSNDTQIRANSIWAHFWANKVILLTAKSYQMQFWLLFDPKNYLIDCQIRTIIHNWLILQKKETAVGS